MRVLSGIQPSGELHLGNYLGALKQFVKLEKEYESFFMVADLHALTEVRDASKLKKLVADTKRAFLALGLNPKKSTLFVQSDIPAHTELAWIFATLTPVSELERMTQFKDKRAQGLDSNAGLLTYPLLMAADILLYGAQRVPVGQDQLQHLELTRDIARRFNATYGETFAEPEPILTKNVARVMSLQDPTKKMSKSLGSKHYVGLFEDEDSIRNKFKRAVTDSEDEVRYDPKNKPGVSNLLTIYAAVNEKSIQDSQKELTSVSYAELKTRVADSVLKHLEPIRARYREFTEETVNEAFDRGEKRAREEALRMLAQAKKRAGLSSNE